MIQETQMSLGILQKSESRESSAVSSKYVEVPGQSSQVDPLMQLRANIQQLESLQGQLSFMVREIKSLTCKRKTIF